MRIERDLGRLGDQPFDLVVVGGGITGVSVAREAAGRGLRTLLVDKDDFGAGTSSATTKYLHGGIRYLETYEFGVVRESLRERRILALAAPHLVRQTRFLMPAWRWSKPPATLIGAGVGLYTALAYDRNRDAPDSLRIPSPRWLPKRRLLDAVPWLDPDELLGGFAYHDTLNLHPERLLLAFLQSAVAAGAVALNHVAAVGFLSGPVEGGDVAVDGVELEDVLTGRRVEVRSRVVVNAAGPWVDVVLARLGRDVGVRVNRSKGVHVLTRPLGGPGVVADAVFARARSGRHVIVSPWMDRSFIGPTDTPDPDRPDEVRVEAADVDELLTTVNATMGPGETPLTVGDVEAVTVGIRPLVVQEGRDSYSTSRRHELYDHAKNGVRRLWSIGGGKWTTGRALAEDLLDELEAASDLAGAPWRRFDSRRSPASGAFAWAEDAEPYLAAAVSRRPELGLDPDVRLHLARLYGTESERILDLVALDRSLGARLSDRAGCLDIAAQAVFAVTDEAARTLADVVDRRLVLGTLGPVTPDELDRVADLVAPLLGWDAERARAESVAETDRRAALEARWRRAG